MSCLSTRERTTLDPTPRADELCARDGRTPNSDMLPLEAAGRAGRSYDLIHHAELADAEQCDATPACDDWLDGIEDAGLPPLPREHLDPIADLDAPLVATWWAEHRCAATLAKLSGAHVSTWQYHEGIEAEVWHLATVCRNSSGTERESTLRQLHQAQSDLDAFRRTPEFQSALRYMLAQVDAAIVAARPGRAGEHAEAWERYTRNRANLAALLLDESDRRDSIADVEVAPREAPSEVVVTPRVKRKQGAFGRQRERLCQVLDALEEYAKARDENFDRSAMPGPLGDDWKEESSFHWLCGTIDKQFRRQSSTFKKYRAGVCATAKYARPGTDLYRPDFYRQALPHIGPKLMPRKQKK